MLGSTLGAPDGLIVGIDEENEMGSLVGSFDDSDDRKLEGSLPGESLVSNDETALCTLHDFFGVTKKGMLEGLTLGDSQGYIDGILPGCNEGTKLGISDGKNIKMSFFWKQGRGV